MKKNLDNDICKFIDVAVIQILLNKTFDFNDFYDACKDIEQKFSVEDCAQKIGLSEDRVKEIMKLNIKHGEVTSDFFSFLLSDIYSLCGRWSEYFHLFKEKDGVEPTLEEWSNYIYKKTYEDSRFNRRNNKFYFSKICLEAMLEAIKSDRGYNELISKAKVEIRISKIEEKARKKFLRQTRKNAKGISFLD